MMDFGLFREMLFTYAIAVNAVNGLGLKLKKKLYILEKLLI
jgi:hypothetical protein